MDYAYSNARYYITPQPPQPANRAPKIACSA